MGIIVNKQNNNDELSRRINADLRAKMEASQEGDNVATDYTNDTEYMKNTKSTSKFGWIWGVLILLAIIAIIIIVIPF